MAIFEIIQEEKASPQKRTAKHWVELGVEYAKAKAKGVTARQFATDKGIPYATFTKSMSRYSSAIKDALELEKLKGRKAKGLSKRERALKMINDFRATMRDVAKAPRPKDKSQKWFENTIKAGIKSHTVTRMEAGKIYTFVYDAKYKDTLPYWDRFPLIICLGPSVTKAGNGVMLGLNLHYAPPKARQAMLEELLKKHASTPSFSNKTRLKINWDDVRGMRGTDQLIKAYLPSHFKSKLVEVSPKDWGNIIFLPTYQFMSKGQKYDARKVWRNF